MKEAERDVNFYNNSYKKRGAERDRDIISYNKIEQHDSDYGKYSDRSDRKEKSGDLTKKESGRSSVKDKHNNSDQQDAGETLCYIVKTGDTLFSIAKRSGTPLKRILDINDLNENSKIYRGMKLKVPSNRESGKKSRVSAEKVPLSSKSAFLWPMKKVKGFSRDGEDGVKSIGIIIKGNPGSEVMASQDGVVKRVGYMRGYGKYIVLKHGKSYITVYSNLMDIDVKAGDKVSKGGRIGNISDDMTLHFQIDRGGKPENPLNLLPGRG